MGLKKIIDNIRGKHWFAKLQGQMQQMQGQMQQNQDFAYFTYEQNRIYRNISFDIGNAHPAQGALKEIQDINFYILKRMKAVSERIGIKFWLHGGSLLGAVRHKGFIPWDDDIDIGIMRSDFETLREYLKDDQELEIKDFYFVPGICSRQPRCVFKGAYKPFFVDLFIYDECHTNDINKTWQMFCARKDEQVSELLSTHICANHHFLIENMADKARIDEIYEKHKFHLNETAPANSIIFNIDEGTNLIKDGENAFVRCFEKDFIFPLRNMHFNGIDFYAPRNYEEYLIKQYGNYMLLPNVLEYSQHAINFDKNTLLEIHKTHKEKIRGNLIGYTAGAFDLFHIGHLNLLRRSKEKCRYLIVGVTTDELIERTKGHKPAIPLEERIEIVKACKYVDEVVMQDDLDKVKAWRKYNYDILFSGDDWKNNERWKRYESELKARGGVKIQYFPYTKTTSSSLINNFLQTTIKSHE